MGLAASQLHCCWGCMSEKTCSLLPHLLITICQQKGLKGCCNDALMYPTYDGGKHILKTGSPWIPDRSGLSGPSISAHKVEH